MHLRLAPQFQTEINDKIPPSVQDACIHEWSAKGAVTVVCAELYGTFYVNSAGEFHIRQHVGGEVVSPNKFEELAGKKTARNWQQSIRLAGEDVCFSCSGMGVSALECTQVLPT